MHTGMRSGAAHRLACAHARTRYTKGSSPFREMIFNNRPTGKCEKVRCPPRVAMKVAYDDDLLLLKRDLSTARVFLAENFPMDQIKFEREIVEKSRILKIYLTKFT